MENSQFTRSENVSSCVSWKIDAIYIRNKFEKYNRRNSRNSFVVFLTVFSCANYATVPPPL